MKVLLFLFIGVFQFSFGQNSIDDEGRKQGEWKKYWDESKQALQYKGTFVNDKPVWTIFGIITLHRKLER